MSGPSYIVYTVFTEVAPWTAFSVLFGLSVLRYSEQRQCHGSLLLEDWLHVLAVIQCWLLNINSAIQAWLITVELNNAGSDTAAVEAASMAGWISNVPQQMLYWTSIYTAKICILFLYRRLFGVSRTFIRAWWASTVYIFAAFVVGILSNFLECGYSISNVDRFADTDPACYFQAATLYNSGQPRQVAMSLAANISTDLLLLILPLPILLRIQAPWSRRLKFLAIALLVIVTICVDLFTWLFEFNENTINVGSVFQNVEPHVTVIVATLPVLLFSSNLRTRKNSQQQSADTPGHSVSPWRNGRPRCRDELELATSEFGEAPTRYGSRVNI